QLIERCQEFYTAERMAEIEAVIPGWKHMASFEHGKTLWHINVAMVALLQLDEYLSMSPSQQTVQQWIVFLHDVAKERVGGADHRHSFRSAAHAGRIMPQLGYLNSHNQRWSDLMSCTRSVPGLSPRCPGAMERVVAESCRKSRLEKSKMLVVEGVRLTPDERACVCKPGLALIFFHQRFEPGHELVDFVLVLFQAGK